LNFGFWIQNAVDGFVYAKNTRNSPINVERTRPTPPATIDYRRRIGKIFGIADFGLSHLHR
jgi:hypothetical protein